MASPRKAPAPQPAPSTPRERRRAQTRDEILDAALAVMTEQGVAALNLTDVARRVGLRQPSLYQYFDSRTAVYDALFERGMRTHHDLLAAAIGAADEGWPGVRAAAWATLRFTVDQPVLTQLLFTPAVPGFTPSEQAYAPSLRANELLHGAITSAVRHHHLHPTAATDRGMALFIALIAGVSAQQQANDPGTGIEEGRYIPLLDPALDMYLGYFEPTRPTDWTPWPGAGATGV
ncbi:TetR/AcrR family transcriptional regulator [Actinopolymorpha rutila]|uniref:AcrR family transcriptional regulator n=1 Tax=Actinopolymorpha rutila TaxID=446787 RepID=A0A852ZD71_9ACTN|nr:TetR/AcrR family transcriptional regulator [Actinopolymorpha rutila]NYH87649.1 AcrR family transcriptional regulator [Actinopolymorpha rutila]